MEFQSIKTIRERYRELLSKDSLYYSTLSVLSHKSNTEPILSILPIDAESDLSFQEEQRQMSEILLDMHAINNGIIEAKNVVQNTIDTLDTSIEQVLNSVAKQREQIQDLNVVCGTGTAYSAILPINADLFGDTNAEMPNDKTFGAAVTEYEPVQYDILSIVGNGYSGNAFVYSDTGFENEIIDKSRIDYIMDSNDVTTYEYSRLCTNDKKEAISGIVNYDNKDVECTITLVASKQASSMQVRSLDPDIIVRKLEISQDGVSYTTCIDRDLYINQTNRYFEDAEYIYGSSILCFPPAIFIRITLAENTATDETVAIEQEDETIQTVKACRKRISLQGIQLYDAEYEEVVLESDNILEDSTVDKVSLFASEYIPDHFPEANYISYSLIINGQEYVIVPVNTGQNGITVVKFSEDAYALNENTQVIHETIKTIRLKIRIRPNGKKETPYISNLKLCIGKNTGNIYV